MSRAFFDVLFGQIPKGAAIEIRYKADPERDLGINKAVKPFKRWYESVDALPEEWRDDAHVFFGVALRQKGKSDPILWPVLWADADSWDDASRGLDSGVVPPPTAIVKSGQGYHLYWRLAAPLLDKAQVFQLVRAIQEALGADPRAAEPARLLRVPGTWNVKYGPPLRAELVELHPDRVYDAAAFGELPVSERTAWSGNIEPIVAEPLPWEIAAAHLPLDLKQLAWAGTQEDVKAQLKDGEGSWSDLDWALAARLAKAGFSKAQVKGFFTSNPEMAVSRRFKHGHPMLEAEEYLHRTIHNAFEEIEREQAAARAAGQVGFTVRGGELYALGPKGEPRVVANFDAEPLSIVEGVGAGIETHLRRHDGHERTVFLDARATSSKMLFKQTVGSTFVWKGSDGDLTAFHDYLLRKRPDLPVKLGTRILGWHYEGPRPILVASNAAWDREGYQAAPEIIYRGREVWTLVDEPEWREQAKRVLALLLHLHEPETVWALLGWTMTTFLTPHVRQARGGNPSEAGEFSGVWLWGEQGGGKSRTAGQFLRLTASPFLNLSGGATVAGLQAVVAETNTLPVFIDDPKKMFRRLKEGDTSFQDVLHYAFGGSPVRKGTKDLSGAQVQPMLAPCLGTSEQAMERDPAFGERYLQIPVSKSYKLKHGETAEAIERLFDWPLERLAYGFFRWVWDVDVPAAWTRALSLSAPLQAAGAQDRIRKSIAQILMGLEIAAEIGELDYGLSYSGIAEALWQASYKDRGHDPRAVYSERLRELVELLWNLISEGKMHEGVDFRVVGDALFVPVTRLLHLVEQNSRFDTMPFTRTTTHNLLNSNLGEIVSGFRRERFQGGAGNEPQCVVFNLSAIEKQMGLTERPWLATRGLQVID